MLCSHWGGTVFSITVETHLLFHSLCRDGLQWFSVAVASPCSHNILNITKPFLFRFMGLRQWKSSSWNYPLIWFCCSRMDVCFLFVFCVIQDQIHNELGQLIVNSFHSFVVFHISDPWLPKERQKGWPREKNQDSLSWHMVLADTSTWGKMCYKGSYCGHQHRRRGNKA